MRSGWSSKLVRQLLKVNRFGLWRIVIVLMVAVTAVTVHSIGIAVSVSLPAVAFIDHVTFTNVSIQIIGYLSISFAVARLISEIMGAEYMPKRMRRDRNAGRPLLRKPQYSSEYFHRLRVLTPVFALLLFCITYFKSGMSFLVLVAPAFSYFLFFLFGEYWASINGFGRIGQSPATVRLKRIARRSPLTAAKSFAKVFFNWLKPRLTGLIAVSILFSGLARGLSNQQDYVSIEAGGQTIQGGIIFRSADGIVVYDSSSDQGFFISNGGIIISLRTAGYSSQRTTTTP